MSLTVYVIKVFGDIIVDWSESWSEDRIFLVESMALQAFKEYSVGTARLDTIVFDPVNGEIKEIRSMSNIGDGDEERYEYGSLRDSNL